MAQPARKLRKLNAAPAVVVTNTTEHRENSIRIEGEPNQRDLINELNDYCLIEIFKHLPLFDRSKLDQVCSRWKRLDQLKWIDVKRFDCGHDYIFPLTVEHKLRLKKTMLRCRRSLNQLKLCICCVSYIMPITLQKFAALRHLTLHKHNFVDGQMRKLTRIKTLVYLDLTNSNWDGEAELISNLVNLQYLIVNRATGLDDRALISIANKCTQILYLDISHCKASASALSELVKLQNLESLTMLWVRDVPEIISEFDMNSKKKKVFLKLCRLMYSMVHFV